MEKKFNVTGELRKELAKATGAALGWEPIYKGAPSFAYAVANVLISKDGTLSWDERTDKASIQKVFCKLRELGFASEDEEIDPDYLRDTLTIEMPLEGFTEAALENLNRLIASKAALIKKSIGASALPIERTETTLVFPWFQFGTAPEEISAYTHFISALCKAAKEQKRVTAKERPIDNEKFAFRVFLIRLGFVGDDFKNARKVLLRNLTGNSAFKNGAPPKAKEEVPADE